MKKIICLAAVFTLVAGLCFAEPLVLKTKSGIELAYTNSEKELIEIYNLCKISGKTRDQKRKDFEMAYDLHSYVSRRYIYCVVSSGKSFAAYMSTVPLANLYPEPQVYWLEENDDLACVFLDCDRLPIDKDLIAGTARQAIEHKHTHLCPKCQERLRLNEE